MTRRRLVTAALVLGIVALFALPLLLGAPSDYAGSDSVATTTIQESNPDYVPWFDAVFSSGSAEIESGLFALQAALGGLVLGYVLGRLRGRRAQREAAARIADHTGAPGPAAGAATPAPPAATTTAEPTAAAPGTTAPTTRAEPRP